MHKELDMSLKCVLVAQMANSIVSSIKREMGSRVRDVSVPLCFAIVRTQLEYCVQVCAQQH